MLFEHIATLRIPAPKANRIAACLLRRPVHGHPNVPNSGFSYADFLLDLPNYSERSAPLLDRMLTTRYSESMFPIFQGHAETHSGLWFAVRYGGVNNYDDGLMYTCNPALCLQQRYL